MFPRPHPHNLRPETYTQMTMPTKDKVKKAVLISAPHTHWLDLFLGLFVKGAIGFKSNFLAKKELFVFPTSLFLKYYGGIPVNRSSKNNFVQYIANLFDKKKEFRISLSPEGTRANVKKFKTGFYYIAKTAKVPIIMITMDYKKKKSYIKFCIMITFMIVYTLLGFLVFGGWTFFEI